MPEVHPALADQGRRLVEHGLDIPYEPDLVPLSCDVIENDLAAALFAHGTSLEWVVFEYDTDWLSLGHTAITTTPAPTPAGAQAYLDIQLDTRSRSRIRRWSPRGEHLVRTRLMRTEAIARLRAGRRTIPAPHGWAIMVWRGRRPPPIEVHAS